MGLFSWLMGGDHPHHDDEPDPHELVLFNDDTHSFEYVIELLNRVFGIPTYEGRDMAVHVHERGSEVVFVGSWEACEEKRSRILAYGRDPRSGDGGDSKGNSTNEAEAPDDG